PRYHRTGDQRAVMLLKRCQPAPTRERSRGRWPKALCPIDRRSITGRHCSEIPSRVTKPPPPYRGEARKTRPETVLITTPPRDYRPGFLNPAPSGHTP